MPRATADGCSGARIRIWPRVKRIASGKLFLAGGAAVLLYALAGSVLGPYLLERYIPRYAHEALGSALFVGHVRINPFLLRLEATDARLEQANGQPLVAFRKLLVDIQLSSLIRRAWTFAEVRVDGLDVSVEVGRDGKLNLAAFFDRVAKREADVSSGREARLRWLVRHLELREAKLRYSDLSGPTPARTDFAPINLRVHDLTTLPGRHGEYEISAALPDGGSIAWRGGISMLPVASEGVLEMKGVKVATAWAFLRDAVRVAEPHGSIDVAARYRFAYAPGGNSTLTLEGIRAQVSGLALATIGSGAPVVAFDAIAASDGRFDLAARELVVPTLELRDGQVAAVRGGRSLDRPGKAVRHRALPLQSSAAGGGEAVEVLDPDDCREERQTGARRSGLRDADHLRDRRRVRGGARHREPERVAAALRGHAERRAGRNRQRDRHDRP